VRIVWVVGRRRWNKDLPISLVRELALVVHPTDANPVVQRRQHLIVSKVPLHTVLLLKTVVLHQAATHVAALLLSLGEDQPSVAVDVARGTNAEQRRVVVWLAVHNKGAWWGWPGRCQRWPGWDVWNGTCCGTGEQRCRDLTDKRHEHRTADCRPAVRPAGASDDVEAHVAGLR
jgi:hypothetical protein